MVCLEGKGLLDLNAALDFLLALLDLLWLSALQTRMDSRINCSLLGISPKRFQKTLA